MPTGRQNNYYKVTFDLVAFDDHRRQVSIPGETTVCLIVVDKSSTLIFLNFK